MRAKLFYAHNQFGEHDTPEAPQSIGRAPPERVDIFMLVDTDETGALICRRIEE
jgi:hypothetical protein